MEPLELRPGARLRVRFPGETALCDAVLDRILDRSGRRLEVVDMRAPPPRGMLVILVEGALRCVPLWAAEGEGAPWVVSAHAAG